MSNVRPVQLTDGRGTFLNRVTLDDRPALILACPSCGRQQYMDDDQARGRVSVRCAYPDCTFHETHDWWKLWEEAADGDQS